MAEVLEMPAATQMPFPEEVPVPENEALPTPTSELLSGDAETDASLTDLAKEIDGIYAESGLEEELSEKRNSKMLWGYDAHGGRGPT